MTPDFNKAATKAAEMLVKFNVRTSPISPLPILEQMTNVVALSFYDVGEISGHHDLSPVFGRNLDAITSMHTEADRTVYVVAYNSLLPFAVIQRALARELGHIVLNHDGINPDNTAEAECFAHHLLCPRPLIHAIQATGIRFTADILAKLTGVFDQSLVELRHSPATEVPDGLNRFVRNQFLPFVLNCFDFFRTTLAKDGSALADFGSFMDGYSE